MAASNNAIHNINNEDSDKKSQNWSKFDDTAMAKTIASISVSRMMMSIVGISQKFGSNEEADVPVLFGVLFAMFSDIYIK